MTGSDVGEAIGDILAPGQGRFGDDPARQESAVRRHFWRVLRRAAKILPFVEDVVAAYYCAFDPATPRKVRLTLIAALAYFVAPFDAVPDLLAAIGFTDDMTVLTAAIGMVAAHIAPRHREAAKRALEGLSRR